MLFVKANFATFLLDAFCTTGYNIGLHTIQLGYLFITFSCRKNLMSHLKLNTPSHKGKYFIGFKTEVTKVKKWSNMQL